MTHDVDFTGPDDADAPVVVVDDDGEADVVPFQPEYGGEG